MSSLPVHIGIVAYHSQDDLPSCFECLHQQTYSYIHITVVNNNSPDKSAEWVKQNAPEVTLIRNAENVGFARAHNQIVRTLPPNVAYMPLNPDVRLKPNYIEKLVAFLETGQAEWVIGKLLLADSPLIYSVGHGLRRGGYAVNIGYRMTDQFEMTREIFGAPGAAPLYSPKFLRIFASELFDEAMFMYGEDVDLDWRARRQGLRCWFVAEAIAEHRGSHPHGQLRAQAVANRYLSTIKNAYLIDLFCYNLPLMTVHCLARLILTPREGMTILHLLLKHATTMWQKRQAPKISRREMVAWFRWSAGQPTGQPRSFWARMGAFWQHILSI